MKYSDLAKKYNTTIAAIKTGVYNFVQSEGYLPNGTECNNIFEWLDATINPSITIKNEPFHKSDFDYGL